MQKVGLLSLSTFRLAFWLDPIKMESSNSTRSNQPSPTSCEPEPELECETKDDEAVVDDDSTTSSDIDTDNPVTTPVQEPEGLRHAHSSASSLTIEKGL